jgi:hypothetical protein
MEAESLDELHSVIEEALQLLLTDLLRDNELDAFLRERGWNAVNLPGKVIPGEEVRFDVPWHLIAESNRDLGSRAH